LAIPSSPPIFPNVNWAAVQPAGTWCLSYYWFA
jgi:hypothetical protein